MSEDVLIEIGDSTLIQFICITFIALLIFTHMQIIANFTVLKSPQPFVAVSNIIF